MRSFTDPYALFFLDPDAEATAGFEPAHKGFADPCLTTWLRRHGYSLKF